MSRTAKHVSIRKIIGVAVFLLTLSLLFQSLQGPYKRYYEQLRMQDIDGFPVPTTVAKPGVHVDFNRTLPGVNFINDRLVAKIGKEKAARETEEDFAGDRWWWIDDNAKSMEVFSMPGVYEQYKDTTDSMVDFIYDMSRDGMCRREKRILCRSIVGGGWGNCERNPENLAKTKHKKKTHTHSPGGQTRNKKGIHPHPHFSPNQTHITQDSRPCFCNDPRSSG